MSGRVAIVTGGGTGIGKAIAEAWIGAGGKVTVCGRREAPLRALAESYPDRVAWLSCDLAQPGTPRALVEHTLACWQRLDCVVNNAARFVFKPLVETSDDELEALVRLNLTVPLALSREAIPHLAKQRGSIVNVSSVVAQAVIGGSVPYAGSKAGLEQVTRALAAEVGPRGVRVNAVAPSLTETEISADLHADPQRRSAVIRETPLGRLGKPSDVAPVVLWLASEAAGWVTGQVVQASGGHML